MTPPEAPTHGCRPLTPLFLRRLPCWPTISYNRCMNWRTSSIPTRRSHSPSPWTPRIGSRSCDACGITPTGHAWRRLPDSWLPQYCVYLASDPHERAHERPRPGRAPRERPTRDDYVVCYVKCLVWWTSV